VHDVLAHLVKGGAQTAQNHVAVSDYLHQYGLKTGR
jgi:hypothetical protein